MVHAHQNLNVSRDLIASLSGVIRYPWASTCYDQPTYQMWTHYFHPLRRHQWQYKMSKI